MFCSDLCALGTPPGTLCCSHVSEQVCVGGEGACVEPEDAEDQAGFEEEVKPCLGCML